MDIMEQAEALGEIAERMALALDGWSLNHQNFLETGEIGEPTGAEFHVVPGITMPDVTCGITRVEDEPGASFVIETGDGRKVTVLVLDYQPH